jgi:GTP-binding protein Era
MNRSARAAVADVDVVCMVVEAGRWTEGDDLVLELVRRARGAKLLVVNKADRVRPREALLPYLEACAARLAWDELVPVSALKGHNVDRLEACIRARLPEALHLFGADELTDRSERFLVAELVREKLFRRLGDEVPHQLTVEIERWEDTERGTLIHAAVLVEREGQKVIVLGRGGERIREVGIEARRDIERLLDRHVRLELWVKVRGGWSDDARMLRRLGYES